MKKIQYLVVKVLGMETWPVMYASSYEDALKTAEKYAHGVEEIIIAQTMTTVRSKQHEPEIIKEEHQ